MAWISKVVKEDPNTPFFAYIAPKAAHEPFNPAPWYEGYWDANWCVSLFVSTANKYSSLIYHITQGSTTSINQLLSLSFEGITLFHCSIIYGYTQFCHECSVKIYYANTKTFHYICALCTPEMLGHLQNRETIQHGMLHMRHEQTSMETFQRNL